MSTQVWLWLLSLIVNAVATIGVAMFTFGRAMDKRISAFDLTLEKFSNSVNQQTAAIKALFFTEQAELREALQKDLSRDEAAVREITLRLRAVENGQDEWTKTLRQRTHELANSLNAIILRVDRLERNNKGHSA